MDDMSDWLILAVGLIIGFCAGVVAEDWLGEAWDWLVSIATVVGAITIVAVIVAVCFGWTPW